MLDADFLALPLELQLRELAAARPSRDPRELLHLCAAARDHAPLCWLCEQLLGESRLLATAEGRLWFARFLIELPETAVHRVLLALLPLRTGRALLGETLLQALKLVPLAKLSALCLIDRALKNHFPLLRDPWIEQVVEQVEKLLTAAAPVVIPQSLLLHVPGRALAALRARAAQSGPAVLASFDAQRRELAQQAIVVLGDAPKAVSQANAEELLARRVYTDPGHFLIELLQNAEDASARTFRVVFDRTRILVWHDGNPFDVRDLVGVTSIGQTTKRKQQIGFFGVGFKSVYEVTERPQVYSDVYELEIADVSIPRALRRRPSELPPEVPPELLHNGTLLVLPLRQPEDPVRSARALYRKAKALDPCVLLTLRSIAVLDLVLTAAAGEGRGERYSLQEEPVLSTGLPGGLPGGLPDGLPGEAVPAPSCEVAIRQSPEGWLRRYAVVDDEFVYDGGARDPGRADRSRVMVGVLLDEKGVPQPLADEAATVYSYLPTAERSGLHLFIQGHFDVPVDRERVTPESPWNRWIMTKVPQQLGALGQKLLAAAGAPTTEPPGPDPAAVARGLLAVLPLERELTSPLFRLIPAGLERALGLLAVLPGTDGRLHPPSVVVVAAPAVARLFHGEPLAGSLLPPPPGGAAARPAELYFLDPELPPRSIEVARALGCVTLTAADLPELLKALLGQTPDGQLPSPSAPAFLRQPPASLLPLYDLLLSELQELERKGRVQKAAELLRTLRALPLLPDDAGRLHRAAPGEGRGPFFAAVAVRRAFAGLGVFVHSAFEEQPAAGDGAARGREFLLALGVERLGVERLAAQTRREDLDGMLRLQRLLAVIADEIPQRARRALAQQPIWPDAAGYGRPLHGPEAAYLAPDPEVRGLFPAVPLLHPEVGGWPHVRELGAASLDVRSVVAALDPAAVAPLRIEPTPYNLDLLQELVAARKAELLTAFPPELAGDGSPRSPRLAALPLWRTIGGEVIAAERAVAGEALPVLLPPGSPERRELAAVFLRPLDAARLQALAPLLAVGSEAVWLARLVAARARPGEPLAAQARFLATPQALAAVVELLARHLGAAELPLLDGRGRLFLGPLTALGDADAQTRALLAGLAQHGETAAPPSGLAGEPLPELISAELRDALTPELRARLVPLPARAVLMLLHATLAPGDEAVPVDSHPLLAVAERRGDLYELLLARQHELFADPRACELLARSRLFPSRRGVLRAPGELVHEDALPDLGLDWSPAAEVPPAVLALLARHLGTGRPSLEQLRRALDRLPFLPAERRLDAALGVAALLGKMAREVAAWGAELPLARIPWAPNRLGHLRRPRELYLPSPQLEAVVGTAADLYAEPRLPGLLSEVAGLAGFRRPTDIRLADVVRHIEHCCAQGSPLPLAVYRWLEEGLKAGTLDGPTLKRELEARRWVCADDGTYWNHRQVLGVAAPRYFGAYRGYFQRAAAELPLLCRLFAIASEVTAATIAEFLGELGARQVARQPPAGSPATADELGPIDDPALPRLLLVCYARLGKSGVAVARELPIILCTERGPSDLAADEPARVLGLLPASATALFRSDTPLLESLFLSAGTLRLTVRGAAPLPVPPEDQDDIEHFYTLMGIPRLREVYTVEVDPAVGADVTGHHRRPILRLVGVLRALLGTLPRVAAQRQQLPRAAWVFEHRLRALLADGGLGIRVLRPLGVRYALPGVGQVRAERAAVYSPARGELLVDEAALAEPVAHLSGLAQGLLPCIYDGQQEEQLADIVEILLPLGTAERMHAYLDRRHFPVAPTPRDEAAQLADRIEELFDYGAHLRLARDFPELQGADLRKWRDASVVAEFRSSAAPAAEAAGPRTLASIAELAPQVVPRLLAAVGVAEPTPELYRSFLALFLNPSLLDLPPELLPRELLPRELPSGSPADAVSTSELTEPAHSLYPADRSAADTAAAFRDLRAEIYREAEQRAPHPYTVTPAVAMATRPADLTAAPPAASQAGEVARGSGAAVSSALQAGSQTSEVAARGSGAVVPVASSAGNQASEVAARGSSVVVPSTSQVGSQASETAARGSSAVISSALQTGNRASEGTARGSSVVVSSALHSSGVGSGTQQAAGGFSLTPSVSAAGASGAAPAAGRERGSRPEPLKDLPLQWCQVRSTSEPPVLPSASAAAPAAGLWGRLRSWMGGGDEPDEAAAPRGWGQGSCFGVQAGIAAQLWATPEALRQLQRQPPPAQLQFAPERLPAPYLYAVHALGVVFNPVTQGWEDPAAADPWPVLYGGKLPDTGRTVQFDGLLTPGDNLLPVPLFSRLRGPPELYGGKEAWHSRSLTASPGRLIVQVAGSVPLRVRYQVALLEVPSLTHSEDLRSLPPQWLQPTLPRKRLPEEVQDFLRTQARQRRSAWARALAVQSFVQWRYRYDANLLGRPAIQAARARLPRGQGHHHLELLHLTGDEAVLGYGSCYELNLLIVELLRQLGVPALAAAGWALNDGRIDSPDHLIALAILASSAGPCPLPLDASVGPSGPRRLLDQPRPGLALQGDLLPASPVGASAAAGGSAIPAVPGPWSAGAAGRGGPSLQAVLESVQLGESEREAQTASLLQQAVTRTSEHLGYPAPDGRALLALTPEQRSRELRQRLGALLGGEHLIGPLLAVLRGELTQVPTLTAELQSLAALGLIETRPMQLYQVTLAERTEAQ